MFRKMLYSFALFFLYVTSCCGAQSESPSNYRQFVHSLTVEKCNSNCVLCTLTLKNGLKFYDRLWIDKEETLEQIVESYREGSEICFESWQYPPSFTILSERFRHHWYLEEEFVVVLPSIEKIEMLKPSKSLPTWYSFPGAIISLSDGSVWEITEGSTLWNGVQVGNHILVSQASKSKYLLINVDHGNCAAESVKRMR